MEWTTRHPTDPTMVARYGHDPARGGTYVEVEHNGMHLVSYESCLGDQAIRDVLDDLGTFGFFSYDDVETALEWLARPTCWRLERPEGCGARQVLRVVERLRIASGE
jgi:hypothetical protein